MRAVVQRVLEASVSVQAETVGDIGAGLCVLVGVGKDDTQRDAEQLVHKVCNLRVFRDAADKMNLSLLDVKGSLLAVSQFTLFGDVRRGHRPSFGEAMEPQQANRLFEAFCNGARALGVEVETGRFGASMQVGLVNDGPVTILLDTKRAF